MIMVWGWSWLVGNHDYGMIVIPRLRPTSGNHNYMVWGWSWSSRWSSRLSYLTFIHPADKMVEVRSHLEITFDFFWQICFCIKYQKGLFPAFLKSFSELDNFPIVDKLPLTYPSSSLARFVASSALNFVATSWSFTLNLWCNNYRHHHHENNDKFLWTPVGCIEPAVHVPVKPDKVDTGWIWREVRQLKHKKRQHSLMR